jgi:Beta galactosidase small chain
MPVLMDSPGPAKPPGKRRVVDRHLPPTIPVQGPRLDVWRAPIDNERWFSSEPNELAWKDLGLHRMQHRVDEITAGPRELIVRTRAAPTATRLGLIASYRWAAGEAGDDALRLTVEVSPDGEWPLPLPRLGVRMAVPSGLGNVEWFRLGPGELRVLGSLTTMRVPRPCSPLINLGKVATV